ncbi:hypothetical protein EJB05_53958, partial [Eragrostis curvula]
MEDRSKKAKNVQTSNTSDHAQLQLENSNAGDGMVEDVTLEDLDEEDEEWDSLDDCMGDDTTVSQVELEKGKNAGSSSMWTGGSVIEQVLEYAKLPTGEQHDELISEHQALESGANTADVQLTARLPGALTVDAKSQKQGHTVETEPVAPGVALLHAREERDTEAKAQTCRTTADVVVPVSGGPVLGDGVVHGEVVGVGSVPVFPGNILALANDNKKAPAFGNNISLGIVPAHEQGKSLAQSAVLQEISTEEDMATPSIALGPLLERALTGLKESMNKNKGAVADDAKCDIPAHLRLDFSGPCALVCMRGWDLVPPC